MLRDTYIYIHILARLLVGTFVFQPHTRHTGGEGSFPSIYIHIHMVGTFVFQPHTRHTGGEIGIICVLRPWFDRHVLSFLCYLCVCFSINKTAKENMFCSGVGFDVTFWCDRRRVGDCRLGCCKHFSKENMFCSG